MASPIEVHKFNAFSDSVRHLAQQMDSRVAPTFMFEPIEGEKKFFNIFGKVTVKEQLERSEQANYDETPRTRRMITRKIFKYEELFDNDWDAGQLVAGLQPESGLVEEVAFAFNRKKDNLAIVAFDADAQSGKDGLTAVSFPAGQDIDVQTGEDTASGLGVYEIEDSGTDLSFNLGKLREARRLLTEADVPEPYFCAVHPGEMAVLLAAIRITSGDFAALRALDSGKIDHFLGFTFIETTEIPKHTSDLNRYCYCYSPRGMMFGLEPGGDMTVSIDPIPERSGSTQLLVKMRAAATRIHEDHVVRINNLIAAPYRA